MINFLIYFSLYVSLIVFIIYASCFIYLRNHSSIKCFYSKTFGVHHVDFNMESLLNEGLIGWVIVFMIPVINILAIIGFIFTIIVYNDVVLFPALLKYIRSKLLKISNLKE